MKVVLYARVSSERQAEKDLSIPAQLKALRDYAARREWEIYGEYIDEAESARTANRPQFQEMIATAKQKNHSFDVILVWKLSRFARNREDSIIYKKLLRRHGIEVISINEQIDDTPSGKLLEGIIEVIDEFYSTNLAHDTLRGMKENASRGYLNGGTPPYGYQRIKVKVGNNDKAKLEIEPAEASVIKEIFGICLKGKGAKEIVKELNQRGNKTRLGRYWNKTTIYYILTNETYTGALVFNRYKKNDVHRITNPQENLIRVENAHPAIIDKEAFNTVQTLLKERSPEIINPRVVSSNYLLAGLLYCGVCGAKMIGAPAKSGKFFYYGCQNFLRKGKSVCNSKLVNQKKLEESVITKLKNRVLTDENLSQLVKTVNEELAGVKGEASKSIQEKDKQIEELKGRLRKLYLALETGRVDLDDLAPRIKELRGQIEELEQSKLGLIGEADKDSIQLTGAQIKEYVTDLRNLLDNSTILDFKAFLRSWIKKIILNSPQGGGIIEYTLAMVPNHHEKSTNLEVLSSVQSSSPKYIKERTFTVSFEFVK